MKSYKAQNTETNMKKIIAITSLIILAITFSLAQGGPPSIPQTFYGEVYFNNDPLTGTYDLKAEVGSEIVGVVGKVINGAYSVDVSPTTGTAGKIKFYINDVATNENNIYDFVFSQEVQLDLTVNEMPIENLSCGNSLIEIGEECDGTNLAGRSTSDCGTGFVGTISCDNSCKINYINCQATANDNSGGGGNSGGGSGSGGGSSSSGGGSSSSYKKPETTYVQIPKETTVLNQEPENKLSSLITGAVTGNKGIVSAIAAFIFIAATFIAFLVIKTRKP
jgi:uncharacterized membrane protein YgcG